MHYDYVIELYKEGFEETDRDSRKYELLDLPTDQLKRVSMINIEIL